MKIITDLFTEKDGATWDYIKITGTVGLVWWSVLQTIALMQAQAFQPEASAFGLSGLILAVGGGVAMRKFSGDSSDSDDSKTHT